MSGLCPPAPVTLLVDREERSKLLDSGFQPKRDKKHQLIGEGTNGFLLPKLSSCPQIQNILQKGLKASTQR